MTTSQSALAPQGAIRAERRLPSKRAFVGRRLPPRFVLIASALVGRRLPPRFVLIASATALATAFARPTQARPQWDTAVTPSFCLSGQEDLENAAFCGSVRGDLLLFREREREIGLGPYATISTIAFNDLRISIGLTALLPIVEDFPLVVSAGPLLRNGFEWGAEGSLFWGVRSFNFHGSYNLAFGLVLGAQHTFADNSENAVSLGLQIDGFVLALPWLLAQGALKS